MPCRANHSPSVRGSEPEPAANPPPWNTTRTATISNLLRSISPPGRRAPRPTSARGLVGDGQRDDVRPRGHRDVLLSVEHVGHGRGLPGLIRLEGPETFAGFRVDGHEAAA